MNKEEEKTQPCVDCGEAHQMLTIESLEKLHKQLNRRYRMFSIGFVIGALGFSIALGVHSYPLGIASLLAEVAYIARVNMVNVNDARVRIKEVRHYIKHETAAVPKQDQPVIGHNSGQYL